MGQTNDNADHENNAVYENSSMYNIVETFNNLILLKMILNHLNLILILNTQTMNQSYIRRLTVYSIAMI